MKTIRLTVLCLALIASSCTQAVPDKTHGASIQLLFEDIDGTLSKAQSNSESNVSRLQAGIYDIDGRLEWEQTYENAFSVAKTISGLEAGEKTVVAVANKEIVMPERLEDFFRIPTSLAENRRGAFVMVGKTGVIADTKPGSATVRLERIAAKISFRSSIILNWNCTPPSDFRIEAVYVANAGAESDLSASGDAAPSINLRHETQQTSDEALRDLTYAEFSSWKGSGDIFNNGVDFYVYPNDTQTRTTLIIRTSFNGHTSYYPLVIDRPIERNTQYRCGTITLTCDGMPSPSDEFSSVKVSYIYESEDWSEQNIGDAISF